MICTVNLLIRFGRSGFSHTPRNSLDLLMEDTHMHICQLTLKCLGSLKGWALKTFPCYPSPVGEVATHLNSHIGLLSCSSCVASFYTWWSLFSPLHPSLSNSQGSSLSPFVHLLAAGIIIDGLKTNWGQGPLVLGHADSWLNQSIRTGLHQYTAYYISICVHCEIFLQSSEAICLSPPRVTNFLVCGYNTSKFQL